MQRKLTTSFQKLIRTPLRLFTAGSNPTSYDNLKKNDWLVADETQQLSKKTHWSASEEFIARIPVVMVDKSTVRCSGGPNISAGHPVVYIKCTSTQPSTCKYCGLRFQLKQTAH